MNNHFRVLFGLVVVGLLACCWLDSKTKPVLPEDKRINPPTVTDEAIMQRCLDDLEKRIHQLRVAELRCAMFEGLAKTEPMLASKIYCERFLASVRKSIEAVAVNDHDEESRKIALEALDGFEKTVRTYQKAP